MVRYQIIETGEVLTLSQYMAISSTLEYTRTRALIRLRSEEYTALSTLIAHSAKFAGLISIYSIDIAPRIPSITV